MQNTWLIGEVLRAVMRPGTECIRLKYTWLDTPRSLLPAELVFGCCIGMGAKSHAQLSGPRHTGHVAVLSPLLIGVLTRRGLLLWHIIRI